MESVGKEKPASDTDVPEHPPVLQCHGLFQGWLC